jgi:hypothetical protein
MLDQNVAPDTYRRCPHTQAFAASLSLRSAQWQFCPDRNPYRPICAYCSRSNSCAVQVGNDQVSYDKPLLSRIVL